MPGDLNSDRLLRVLSCCLLLAFSSCENPTNFGSEPRAPILSGFRGKDTMNLTYFTNVSGPYQPPPQYATPNFDGRMYDSIQVNLSYQNINPLLLVRGDAEYYQGELLAWARLDPNTTTSDLQAFQLWISSSADVHTGSAALHSVAGIIAIGGNWDPRPSVIVGTYNESNDSLYFHEIPETQYGYRFAGMKHGGILEGTVSIREINGYFTMQQSAPGDSAKVYLYPYIGSESYGLVVKDSVVTGAWVRSLYDTGINIVHGSVVGDSIFLTIGSNQMVRGIIQENSISENWGTLDRMYLPDRSNLIPSSLSIACFGSLLHWEVRDTIAQGERVFHRTFVDTLLADSVHVDSMYVSITAWYGSIHFSNFSVIGWLKDYLR